MSCTETPDYFPPCVGTSPCPSDDAAVDGEASIGDASADADPFANLADAAVVAADAADAEASEASAVDGAAADQ